MYLYLVLSYTGSAPSKLIKMATGDKYTHVSISKNEDLSVMYSFGRKYNATPVPAGFITEDISKGLFNNAKVLIYRLKVDEHTVENFDNYIEDLKLQRTYYDYKGAIGVYLNKDKFGQGGYVCSSFVYEILQELELIEEKTIDNKSKWNIKPEDFKSLDNIELIYEGEASNFMAYGELVAK